MIDNEGLIKISEAARILNISMQTLRRWDKSGRLRAIRFNHDGYRYYKLSDIQLIGNNIFSLAEEWVSKSISNLTNNRGLKNEFFCLDSPTFQTRLQYLEKMMLEIPELKKDFSLITSVVGEIGNNSFDHNLGSWPDIRGIFFAYNLYKRQIALADRGQGILTTLQRVRSTLTNDQEALLVSFTEKLSGRAPENRGNGLKYVKKVIIDIKKDIALKLYFQSGSAYLILDETTNKLEVRPSTTKFRGCLALISF